MDSVERGTAQALWVVAGGGSAVPCRLAGWPATRALIPHGIALVGQHTLFVVNHAYSKGGERIERFRVDGDLSAHAKNVTLTYERSVIMAPTASNLAGPCAMNSVAPNADGSFFASMWLPRFVWHEPNHAPRGEAAIPHRTEIASTQLAIVPSRTQSTLTQCTPSSCCSSCSHSLE